MIMKDAMKVQSLSLMLLICVEQLKDVVTCKVKHLQKCCK